jgi:hypothetical protein
MHALTISFVQGLSDEQYKALCDHFVEVSDAIDGLVAKVFVHQGDRAGGFYVFRDEAAADAYLAGPIVAELASIEALQDVQVQRYEVDVEHTIGLPAPTAAR